jgi:hypothetical protein
MFRSEDVTGGRNQPDDPRESKQGAECSGVREKIASGRNDPIAVMSRAIFN